jgi:hypothetical protein
MTPLLTLETLAIVARKTIEVGDTWADKCIHNASVLISDLAGRPDWIGFDALGNAVTPVAAPRRAVMIAEQLAGRAYNNPDAIVREGSLGTIGGDSMVEDFARTFEPTQLELDYLEHIRVTTGIVDVGGVGGLWVLSMENRPGMVTETIYLPDLDPLADPWPMGTEGIDTFAYGPPV